MAGLPHFKIRVWWPHPLQDEAPSLLLGTRAFEIPRDSRIRVRIPFDSPNALVYTTAKQLIVIHHSHLDRTYEFDYDPQRLYNDLREARREHYQYTRPQLAPAEPVPLYERVQRPSAREKARILLSELCPTDYCISIERGQCFYIQSDDGRRFIIDPSTKNLIWLAPDSPKGLCVYIEDHSVQSNEFDWAIAVWLYLHKSSQRLIDSSNQYNHLRPLNWEKGETQ